MRNTGSTGGPVWVPEGDPIPLPDTVSFNRDGADPITFSNDQAIFNTNGSVYTVGWSDLEKNEDQAVYLKNSKGTKYSIKVFPSTGRVLLEKE